MNLSKKLLLLLTLSAFQLSSHEKQVEFSETLIISLGFNCTPAMNIEKNNLRTFAFPFDWMGSSLEGLCALLEDDFQDFLNPAYLYKTDEGNIIINSKYNVGFWHDFPTYKNNNGQDLIVPNWVEAIPEIFIKYDRRIKRLYKALNSDRTIYLLRSACSRHWPLSSILQTKETVIKLQTILQNKFPNANFTLVVIGEDPDTYYNTDWDIPGIRNFYMQDYQMPHEWTQILKELNLLQ